MGISVVVLEESPCPRGSSRTNFQVLVLESQVLDNNTDGNYWRQTFRGTKPNFRE